MTRDEAAAAVLRGATLRAELYEVELRHHLKSCPGVSCTHYIHREIAQVRRWLQGLHHSRRLPGWVP